MSAHEPSRTTAGIPLPALVAELRGRCEAASRLQGGSTHYQEELGIFRSLAETEALFLGSLPPELNRTPDEEGNEHQVWYEKELNVFLKATWPDFFVMLVVHRPDAEPKASPIDYLEPWVLHNELTPRLAKAYCAKSLKTLQRDLSELQTLNLILRRPGGVKANRDIVHAFRPLRKKKSRASG